MARQGKSRIKKVNNLKYLLKTSTNRRGTDRRTAIQKVCGAQNFVDSSNRSASNGFNGQSPDLRIPRPRRRLGDIAHGCSRCGTELVRSIIAEQRA
jgi:hypothetical protein